MFFLSVTSDPPPVAIYLHQTQNQSRSTFLPKNVEKALEIMTRVNPLPSGVIQEMIAKKVHIDKLQLKKWFEERAKMLHTSARK